MAVERKEVLEFMADYFRVPVEELNLQKQVGYDTQLQILISAEFDSSFRVTDARNFTLGELISQVSQKGRGWKYR